MTSWSSKIIIIIIIIIIREMERDVYYSIPGGRDRGAEAGKTSHLQVLSARKDPFRPRTKPRSPAVPGIVCAVLHGRDQNLSIPPRK